MSAKIQAKSAFLGKKCRLLAIVKPAEPKKAPDPFSCTNDTDSTCEILSLTISRGKLFGSVTLHFHQYEFEIEGI